MPCSHLQRIILTFSLLSFSFSLSLLVIIIIDRFRWILYSVIGLDKIVAQVVKVDPDGVDIVCFGGNEGADWYRNVKNTKKLEEMVNDKRPSGVSYLYIIIIFLSFSFITINYSHTNIWKSFPPSYVTLTSRPAQWVQQ